MNEQIESYAGIGSRDISFASIEGEPNMSKVKSAPVRVELDDISKSIAIRLASHSIKRRLDGKKTIHLTSGWSLPGKRQSNKSK
jgi:hypothetical protein